jgi:DNA-binding LacI/PurR family transcriptional regulator
MKSFLVHHLKPFRNKVCISILCLVQSTFNECGRTSKVRETENSLGSDIGIISFNETVFKEPLDITVITTDFEEMSRSAAKMIFSGNVKQIKSLFRLIRRSSL